MKNFNSKSKNKMFTLAAGALAIGFFAAASAFAAESLTEIGAEAAYYTVSSENASLILPADYSQYLNLSSPTACAASEEYIAVSDGATIYIYDKNERLYRSYVHSYNRDDTLNSVAQVDFCDDGYLYFTDASTYLYRLNMADLTATRTGITCSTFATEGRTVYFATIVNGRVTIVSVPAETAEMSSASVIYTLNTYSSPAICCDTNGNLFFTDGVYLYDYTSNSMKSVPVSGTVTSCKCVDEVFYLCDSTGRFSVYNYAADAIEKYYEGNYAYIDYFSGTLYAVNSATVEEFDCEKKEFTDYRICSYSSAVGRLNGACDAEYVNGKLIIAESGNSRVSIYNESDGSYEILSPGFIPEYVAADSSSIMVCSSSRLAIYTYTGRTIYEYTAVAEGEEIRGAENVYGNYYVITSGNAFIKISGTEGDFNAQKIYKQLAGVGEDLSSDVYGNLILKTVSGAVYTFSEDAFMAPSDSGTLKYTFPVETHGFFSDYRGDVFAVSGSSVISDCGITVSVSSDGCVYQSEKSPIKIAASFDKRGGYIIYSNYIIYTENINVPTLNDISTEESDSTVFLSGAAEPRAVSIHKNAVEIFFDFSKYQDASVFPYLSHERISGESKAIVISETSEYYVIGAVSEKTKKYRTGIVLKTSCDELSAADIKYTPEEYSSVGYATNDVPLYRYACFSSETGSLKKGGEVVIEYAINLGTGFNFCRVDYSYNGTLYSGYVPLAYLIPTGVTTEEKTSVSYAYITVDDEFYTMLADDGTALSVSTKEKFTVIGDPYSESEVKLSYSSGGKTYYTTIDSSLLKTNNSAQIRVFAIIVIGVVIVLIVVNYAVLSSRRKKKNSPDDFE